MAYEELGTVGQQTVFYPPGSRYKHPSGTWYVHRDGHWQVDPDQRDEPTA